MCHDAKTRYPTTCMLRVCYSQEGLKKRMEAYIVTRTQAIPPPPFCSFDPSTILRNTYTVNVVSPVAGSFLPQFQFFHQELLCKLRAAPSDGIHCDFLDEFAASRTNTKPKPSASVSSLPFSSSTTFAKTFYPRRFLIVQIRINYQSEINKTLLQKAEISFNSNPTRSSHKK